MPLSLTSQLLLRPLSPFPFHTLSLSPFTVDEKEECPRLVGHGSSDERLPGAGRSVEEDAARWLHSDGSEQLRVAEWKLHHL